MHACIKEALRLYPLVADGKSRVVVKGGRLIAGKCIPEEVSLPRTFYIMSLTLKTNNLFGQSIVSISAYQRTVQTRPRSCVGRMHVATNTALPVLVGHAKAYVVFL